MNEPKYMISSRYVRNFSTNWNSADIDYVSIRCLIEQYIKCASECGIQSQNHICVLRITIFFSHTNFHIKFCYLYIPTHNHWRQTTVTFHIYF